MKVLCLAVCEGKKILAIEHELSSFSYFSRGSIQEGMNFFVQTVVERTPNGQRATVQQDNYTGHVYVSQDGLAAVIVTDAEYPQRVAFSVAGKCLDEFKSKFPRRDITPETTSQRYPELRQHLEKAQDPQSNDPFMKVQRELDETKVILHKTMDSLLQRGEKLDDLVQRSDQLSAQSKMFYKTAKKTNACCTYV
ncbi:palmitoyltransferase [Terramyces sp. JEL0728]|nr:palmitoyltransferase [Terramyces sp. JEL0728]